MTIVRELDPNPNALATRAYERPDYLDRFTVDVGDCGYGDVDAAVAAWFMRQPWWIRLLSTNVLRRSRIEAALATGQLQVGTHVGAWAIIARTPDEIMFGESMGFMEYRVSFCFSGPAGKTVEVANAVKYLWPRTGPFYFALVKPLHKRFLRLMLGLLARA